MPFGEIDSSSSLSVNGKILKSSMPLGEIDTPSSLSVDEKILKVAMPSGEIHSPSFLPPQIMASSNQGRYVKPPIYAQCSRKDVRNPYRYPPTKTRIREGDRPQPILRKDEPAPLLSREGDGPSGVWEPSILNLTPSEDLTRVLCDFIYNEVVLRDDVGEGAVLEIEAKIGQLVDKNTNDRIRLPVMTESVVCKNDPNLRIAFESSMTEVILNQSLDPATPKLICPTDSAQRIQSLSQ